VNKAAPAVMPAAFFVKPKSLDFLRNSNTELITLIILISPQGTDLPLGAGWLLGLRLWLLELDPELLL
jgi:hypothetical protein